MKLNHTGQPVVLNSQEKFPLFLLQSQGSSQAIFLAAFQRSEKYLAYSLTKCFTIPVSLRFKQRVICLTLPPQVGLGFVFCLLNPAHLQNTKFKFTQYTNALKVKVSFGSLLSSLCSLVFHFIFHFLASLLSILSCFFSRSFAQGTWSIILKEIQISFSHNCQVLLKKQMTLSLSKLSLPSHLQPPEVRPPLHLPLNLFK